MNKYDTIEAITAAYDTSNLVDLETAKLLKSLGYDKPTFFYHLGKDLPWGITKGIHRVKLRDRRMNHNRYDEFVYSAPTKKEATNWLKKHNNA